MQTIEEYKEYTKQLEGEVKQWHDAFDASQVQVKELAKENLRLERERVEQNSIIETCANELEELRLHEVEWDLAKARIKELEAEINRKDGVCKRWFERCMEARTENVKTKRELWLSRAERARDKAAMFWNRLEDVNCRKWQIVKHKCRAKAEKYK